MATHYMALLGLNLKLGPNLNELNGGRNKYVSMLANHHQLTYITAHAIYAMMSCGTPN